VLQKFLDAKPLFYDEIDYARMPRIYNRIKKYFSLANIIHIIGTNGKGTTGRFLASALYHLGYNTGHYTSPHILEFNERIWFNSKNVSMHELEDTHMQLLSLLTSDEAKSLSYFEYTTLLAMLYFSNRSDFVILEAGLGGEHDATAVFANNLTLITPIDKDHESFLGNDIQTIARTKLNAIQKAVIIAKQKHVDVYKILDEIAINKDIDIYRVEDILTEDDVNNMEIIIKKEHLPLYLQQNLSLAITALHYFNIAYTPQCFYNARLFGRLTYLNDKIIVDVGHNTLAAESIATSLKDKKYILVYNSYKDKNYNEILKILQPIIKRVELIDVYNTRIAESSYLQESLKKLGMKFSVFKKIDEEEDYLVFGSFSVVEAFLKVYRG